MVSFADFSSDIPGDGFSFFCLCGDDPFLHTLTENDLAGYFFSVLLRERGCRFSRAPCLDGSRWVSNQERGRCFLVSTKAIGSFVRKELICRRWFFNIFEMSWFWNSASCICSRLRLHFLQGVLTRLD